MGDFKSKLRITAFMNSNISIIYINLSNMANTFKSETVVVYAESGSCPTSPANLGLNATGAINAKYVKSVTINTTTPNSICAFEFPFNNTGMSAGIAGKTLVFAMMNYSGNGSARWECSSDTIKQLYLPTVCQGV